MIFTSNLQRYGLAIIMCGLALALARLWDAPSSCFVLAVMVTGLYAGRGPGLLCTALSSLAFAYFFLTQREPVATGLDNYSRFALLIGALLLVNYLISAKLRSDEERRKSDEHYRVVTETALDAILSIDDKHQIVFANAAAEKIFGWSLSELIGSPLTMVIAGFPFDRTAMVTELAGRRKDGTEFTAEVSFVEIAEDGHPGFTGFVRDISERKRAEEALRTSEQSLRLMVNSIPGLVSTMTASGDLELANKQIIEYTGKTIEEIKNWLPTIHPEDRTLTASRWRHSVETGDPFDVETRIESCDGVYRWFHARGLPWRDAEGHIARWYILLTDIDDRKRVEEALRKSERDLGLIVETIPALVWSASPVGELTYVNQRVLDYIGVGLDALAASGWTDFLHPDDYEPTVRAWTHAVRTGLPHEVQYRLRRFDGTYRWFQVLGQPLHDSEGRVIRWYGLLIDIDDRKNMEDALRSTQARLSRATQIATVGELAASIAHEVNQPLTAVVANGHACLRWLSLDPPNMLEATLAADRIIRNGNSAAEVVRRIRALFKQAEVQALPLDLNEVLNEVVRLLKGEIAKHGVVVQAEFGEDLPPVIADRLQLQQVIFNLMQNGIEAMDALNDRPRKLVIRSKRKDEDTALIEIRDYGPGLNDLDKSFEAFYTTKQNGMGMGLAICRSIIDAHHGRLWAAQTEGPGATFCFTLPLQNTHTAVSTGVPATP